MEVQMAPKWIENRQKCGPACFGPVLGHQVAPKTGETKHWNQFLLDFLPKMPCFWCHFDPKRTPEGIPKSQFWNIMWEKGEKKEAQERCPKKAWFFMRF